MYIVVIYIELYTECKLLESDMTDQISKCSFDQEKYFRYKKIFKLYQKAEMYFYIQFIFFYSFTLSLQIYWFL